MNTETTLILDEDTQAMLDCLRDTATQTLDRKRRLGHYAVIWQDNAPLAIGDDAPEELSLKHTLAETPVQD